jgi:hypothetical protein
VICGTSKRYDLGFESVEGFHLLVMVDSEIGLILGDIAEETVAKKFKTTTSTTSIFDFAVGALFRQYPLFNLARWHCNGGLLSKIVIF